MLVKTFQASNITDAMQMVKMELGPDAMIISTRKERKPGFFGFFCKPVFAITATLGPAPRPVQQEEKKPERGTAREEFRNSMLEPLVREMRELRNRMEVLTREKVPAAEKAPAPGKTPRPSKPASADGFSELPLAAKMVASAEEGKEAPLRIVRESTKVAAAPERAAGSKLPPSLQQLADDLANSGLNQEICGQILEKARSLNKEGTEGISDVVKESLSELIPCAATSKFRRKKPRIISLVGATGVGKTTTIAKLAAMFTVKKKKTVALITIDTTRAGAVEQLRTYAKVLGLPLESASTPEEFGKALNKHAAKDVILVDTGGTSPRDTTRLQHLSSILQTEDCIENHLCLSATTKESDLNQIVQKFGSLPVHRLLFTKLDESSNLGCVVNIPVKYGLPVSFLADGQRVPEDLETAAGRKIAGLVLGGKNDASLTLQQAS